MADAYEDILLPTDGSEGIGPAAGHAARLADTYGATIHVLSVADTRNRFESPSSGISTDAWAESERERAEDAVDRTIDVLPDDCDVERVVKEGVPKTQILSYVKESDVDLVVMATHGRTGLDHYLIGSVTEKVVRRSPVPVMSVRLDDDA